MAYSETQFQRELLKALNKIASEIHESNSLAKKSVEMQERMMKINEAASHQMSIEEYKIIKEAEAMMLKKEENLIPNLDETFDNIPEELGET